MTFPGMATKFANCSQDDARTTPLSPPLFARCTFSSASSPLSYLVFNKKLSHLSRTLDPEPDGLPNCH